MEVEKLTDIGNGIKILQMNLQDGVAFDVNGGIFAGYHLGNHRIFSKSDAIVANLEILRIHLENDCDLAEPGQFTVTNIGMNGFSLSFWFFDKFQSLGEISYQLNEMDSKDHERIA